MRNATRHVRSAFSLGTGYERTPVGLHIGDEDVLGYYIDFTAKTRAGTASSPDDLGHAALAQLALGWWERHVSGEPAAISGFLDARHRLEDRAVRDEEAVVWRYDVPLPKYRLEPGWISALAQAQAASVFVRAYLYSARPEDAELAHRAVLPLLQEGPPSVLSQLEAGHALEECPTTPPSLILNGWIYAAWGLRDVALGLDCGEASSRYEDTMSCLLANLERYDAGWWSRYSLYPHRMPDLAKPFYHRLHVDQLRAAARLTGVRAFADMAERWQSYDTRRNQVALVGQKAVFVASGYR